MAWLKDEKFQCPYKKKVPNFKKQQLIFNSTVAPKL
jgi:hypothetical protein